MWNSSMNNLFGYIQFFWDYDKNKSKLCSIVTFIKWKVSAQECVFPAFFPEDLLLP